MREAMGGSLLLYLLIPIIILFIVFIGFIMNYSAAYRAGNEIVSQIEGNNQTKNQCDNINLQIVKEKYHYLETPVCKCLENSKGAVYQISLNVSFELPIIGKIGVYKVKAETKTIVDGIC